jgi:hypothetical protein
MQLLREVLQYSDTNRMTSSSLALVFSPGVFGSSMTQSDPISYLMNAQVESRCFELLVQRLV